MGIYLNFSRKFKMFVILNSVEIDHLNMIYRLERIFLEFISTLLRILVC